MILNNSCISFHEIWHYLHHFNDRKNSINCHSPIAAIYKYIPLLFELKYMNNYHPLDSAYRVGFLVPSSERDIYCRQP